MSIEEKIKMAFSDLLPLCSPTAGGYNYDWSNCTIDPEDDDINSIASDKFPVLSLTFPDEICENPEDNTVWLSNMLSLTIDAIPMKEDNTKKTVSKLIKDLKRFIGKNPTLNGSCFCSFYSSYKRFFTLGNKDYGAQIKFKIRYHELRNNP